MKLGLTVVWIDVRNGVHSGSEFSNLGEWVSYDSYRTTLKMHVPKYQINLTKPEVKGNSRKRGLAAESPKIVASNVCPSKTNAGVYSNVLHSCV